MNTKQREIIASLQKTILDNSESGDWVNCFNDTKDAIKELAKTDTKLDQMIDEVNESFENN